MYHSIYGSAFFSVGSMLLTAAWAIPIGTAGTLASDMKIESYKVVSDIHPLITNQWVKVGGLPA